MLGEGGCSLEFTAALPHPLGDLCHPAKGLACPLFPEEKACRWVQMARRPAVAFHYLSLPHLLPWPSPASKGRAFSKPSLCLNSLPCGVSGSLPWIVLSRCFSLIVLSRSPPWWCSLEILPCGAPWRPPLWCSLEAPLWCSLEAPLVVLSGSPPVVLSRGPPLWCSLEPPLCGTVWRPPLWCFLETPPWSSLEVLPYGALWRPPLWCSLEVRPWCSLEALPHDTP